MKFKIALPMVLFQFLNSLSVVEGQMKVVGHRGAPAFVIENTIELFKKVHKKCRELGIDAVMVNDPGTMA